MADNPEVVGNIVSLMNAGGVINLVGRQGEPRLLAGTPFFLSCSPS